MINSTDFVKGWDSTTKYLFFLWAISIPFRTSVFSVDLSFFTVYPNLVFTGLLAFYLAFQFKFIHFNKISIVILLLLALFCLYGFAWIIFQGGSFFAFFDIHSFVMQFLYCFIIFSLYSTISWINFEKELSKLLWFYISVLLFFGFFEFLTLYHPVGSNVEKLTQFPISSTFVAPFFIYDNQNDYCLYLLLVIQLLFFIDPRVRRNPTWYIFLLLTCLFFGWLAQARLVIFICLIFLFVSLISQFPSKYKEVIKSLDFKYVIAFVGLLFSLLVTLDFFDGSKYKASNKRFLSQIYIYEADEGQLIPYEDVSGTIKNNINKTLIAKEKEEHLTSIHVRQNLLSHGVDLIKRRPLLGTGPGQFAASIHNGENSKETGGINNPHNFVIELIAQYGLLGWMYFGVLIYLIIYFFKVKFDDLYFKYILILSIILYPFLGLIPSSFSYINLHWLFLPILICLYSQIKKETVF